MKKLIETDEERKLRKRIYHREYEKKYRAAHPDRVAKYQKRATANRLANGKCRYCSSTRLDGSSNTYV